MNDLKKLFEQKNGQLIHKWKHYFDTESVVRCTIPRLDLGPAKYRLSFGVADSSGQWLDIVENGAGFTVESTNGFRNLHRYAVAREFCGACAGHWFDLRNG